MRRLWTVAVVALLGLGCASEGGKGEWDEFWKDLRGDNMKMMADRPPQDRPASMRPSD